jgi:hypothetical protein
MEFKKENGKVLIEAPCKYCGGVYATLHEGKGPHAAELWCKECKRHNQWMSQGNMDIYECYMKDSPIDALIIKILNAKSDVYELATGFDWVAKKVADKKLKTLKDALYKMPGHEAFTGYGT